MPDIFSEEEALVFERELVNLLDTEREKRAMTRNEWGKLAFADAVVGTQGKIQDIVGKRGSRKPKRLSIGDFVKLCQVLERDPSQLLAVALYEHSRKT